MYYFELECYGYAPLNWHFSSFAPVIQFIYTIYIYIYMFI